MRNTILKPGQKFGKWTTISFHNYKELNEKVGKWKCICDCGYEKFIRAANLVGKYTSMCKTCSNKINTQVNLKPDKGACKTKILIQIKRQASSRNLEMLLTDSEILEITSKNCFYCKKEPFNNAKSSNGDFILFNGIDRVNNLKGYTNENTVPCCKYCNISKLDLSLNDWMQNISNIYQNKHEILKRSETISKESTD